MTCNRQMFLQCSSRKNPREAHQVSHRICQWSTCLVKKRDVSRIRNFTKNVTLPAKKNTPIQALVFYAPTAVPHVLGRTHSFLCTMSRISESFHFVARFSSTTAHSTSHHGCGFNTGLHVLCNWLQPPRRRANTSQRPGAV